MPDDNPPAGAPAPATPPVQTSPAATPPAQSPADTLTLTTAQLNERLERAKATLLKELGVADLAKAQAAIAAAAKAEEDAKSAAQKLGETASTLKTLEAERDRYMSATRDHAARQMAALLPEHQAVIKKLAGDDPALQLSHIDTLRPTWASAPSPPSPPAAAVPPAATPPAATAATPPATTAPPAGSAPPAVAPTSPPDHKAQYKALQKTNPVAAAHYLQAHAKQIYPEQ